MLNKVRKTVDDAYARLNDNLQDKDKQKTSLTRAYVIAFSIIAALSILGHMLTLQVTNDQRENADVTFTITNMRSLVDAIVSQASAFKTSNDSFDDDMLSQSIAKIQRERGRVEAYGSSAVAHMFRDKPFLLNEKLDKFLAKTEELARNQRTAQRDAAIANFAELSGEMSRVLKINLDLALDQYRESFLRQIERAYRLQYIGVILILLVLVIEAAFIFRPLAIQLGEYHKHLIHLAYTDALTGLNNRRAFMQLAVKGMDYAHRHKSPFAFVLMDLDHFKSVNDTYGHKVGDLVLQHYSALLQKHLRAHDTLGRIGGEEFAIFLPQTTAEEAQPMIDRFRKVVSETPCPYMDGRTQKELFYSSSFGIIAVANGAGDWNIDNLLVKADQNLYKAKEQGRNCVVMERA